MKKSIIAMVILVLLLTGCTAGAQPASYRQISMEEAIHTAIAFGIITGIVLTVVGVTMTPTILQWISAIVPPRYYIETMRKLMIMGVGIGEVAHEVAVLVVMTVVLLAIALKKFNVRLE